MGTLVREGERFGCLCALLLVLWWARNDVVQPLLMLADFMLIVEGQKQHAVEIKGVTDGWIN